jgi:hypothetical protein
LMAPRSFDDWSHIHLEPVLQHSTEL